MSEESEAKKIWQTLSKLNVNEFTEKKANLTYLSWAWAYQTMMDHYPDMQIVWYTFRDVDGMDRDVLFYPDRTASVHCAVFIGSVRKEMWLPVMDNRNNAVANPDSRAISDTKMRCLVKCFALFGLGLYIFAGSDLPQEDKFEWKGRVKTPDDFTKLVEMLDEYSQKLKTRQEFNALFKQLEPVFSDLREIKDEGGSTGYDAIVALFKRFTASLK